MVSLYPPTATVVSTSQVRSLTLEEFRDLSPHTAIPGQHWNIKPCPLEARAPTLVLSALLSSGLNMLLAAGLE